ncbi:hypothetical protein ES703_76396 [subsurface metagenome]
MRLGQGGFRDNRSPIGVLGGGEVALDIKLGKRPFAVSISQEYYTNDPVADSCYEIGSLFAVNVFYMRPIFRKWKSNVWLGGGIGTLAVGAGPNAMEKGILFDLVGGINIKLFWKIGIYATGKYIYSSKTTNNVKVIDFSDFPVLVGISLNFGW